MADTAMGDFKVNYVIEIYKVCNNLNKWGRKGRVVIKATNLRQVILNLLSARLKIYAFVKLLGSSSW
jgi:hypothetical protein